MITFSAFADEIGPELALQIETCKKNGVRCIDVRGIDGKNVSAMTLGEASEYNKQMVSEGVSVPCIGSPIGKIRTDEDFDAHLELLRHCGAVARAFGTNRIRVFSFYPPKGGDIVAERAEVMRRLAAMVKVAEESDLLLMLENEKAIYDAVPERVKDIFATVASDRLQGIFDPANYVEEGVAPYEDGWQRGLDELTDYFHIKDKASDAATCVPAGQGEGQIEQIFRDLKARDWSGFMTLEPHMSRAGQFDGFTGPELFEAAVNGLKDVCDRAGLTYTP